MWEIIIISITGLAALAYLIIFFIRQLKRKNTCAGCPYADECREINRSKTDKK